MPKHDRTSKIIILITIDAYSIIINFILIYSLYLSNNFTYIFTSRVINKTVFQIQKLYNWRVKYFNNSLTAWLNKNESSIVCTKSCIHAHFTEHSKISSII
jgi:hypothetical protein